MPWTVKDRFLISNQLKILEKLYPDEAHTYQIHRKAVEHGFVFHYSWMIEHLKEEMPVSESEEVVKIFMMYRALKSSFKNLKDRSGINEEDLLFRGFNKTTEEHLLAYAKYFLFDLQRFKELHKEEFYPSLESPTPMLKQYRRMLLAWNEFPDKENMTKEQIQQLLR